MKKLASVFAVAFLACAAFARAQSVLPDHFGKWKTSGASLGAAVSTNVTGEAVRTRSDVARYVSGDKSLAVTVEEFRDPSSAYEVYTSRLSPRLTASTVAELTAAGNDGLIALVGNRVVTVSQIRNATDAELKLLLDSVKQTADTAPLPPIRAYLPEEQLIQGTQRYALGPEGFSAALDSVNASKFSVLTPEIGFKTGAEAMLASYAVGRDKTQSLLLIDYPTPQLAEQHLHHLQPLLAANPAFAGATIERKSSLLSLVVSPVSAQSAAKLREQIRFEQQVTWNEGSHTLTDPPWLVTVKNLFIGTFAFCGVAIVLGIAFGGVRVLTKRLFPGKVFDRHKDIEVLQLGLSGKRIDPTDLY